MIYFLISAILIILLFIYCALKINNIQKEGKKNVAIQTKRRRIYKSRRR